MKDNIEHTKQKLTNIFVILVFIIIFIFWTAFFTAKYFSGVSIEKREYSGFSRLLDSGKVNLSDIKQIATFRWPKEQGENHLKLRMSYIQFSPSGEVISSSVHKQMDAQKVVGLFKEKNIEQFDHKRWLFLKKIYNPKDNSTYILFKQIRYTFFEYLWDIFSFLILNFVLSVFLYVIGRKFINKTFIPVEENIKDMKDFVHNAWHELKTPISVIDSNIQLIDDIKKYDPKMTGELKSEVLRLNGIIDGLIELSNIDNFHTSQENNLYEAVAEVLDKNKKWVQKKKIIIKNKINPNIKLEANSNYLHIFLANLIKNAIKYNVVGGTISLESKDGNLIITDSWIGIDKKEIKNIFKRFYKCDISRSSEWFWIGLSLVQKIADIYGWKIKVKSKTSQGSSFIIKL